MSDERGRPCVYTPEAARVILDGLAEGKSLRAICRENESLPGESTVRGWVVEDVEGFAAHYTRSRDIGLDCRADALIEDAKAAKDAGLGRLSFDADRWYLSKMAPKRYGDKQTTVHEDPQGNNPFASLMEAVQGAGRPKPGVSD